MNPGQEMGQLLEGKQAIGMITSDIGWLKRENLKRSNKELKCPVAGCRRTCAETGRCAEADPGWGVSCHGRDTPVYSHRACIHLNDAQHYEHLGM